MGLDYIGGTIKTRAITATLWPKFSCPVMTGSLLQEILIHAITILNVKE